MLVVPKAKCLLSH